MENKLPSRYQVNDIVSVASPKLDFVINKARVHKVHFSERKVSYDLDIEIRVPRGTDYTRIYNVDSYWVSDYVEIESKLS